jgi:hypothetical protein
MKKLMIAVGLSVALLGSVQAAPDCTTVGKFYNKIGTNPIRGDVKLAVNAVQCLAIGGSNDDLVAQYEGARRGIYEHAHKTMPGMKGIVVKEDHTFGDDYKLASDYQAKAKAWVASSEGVAAIAGAGPAAASAPVAPAPPAIARQDSSASLR